VAHDCAKHLLPAFGFRWCYAELKDRLRAGEHLSIEELTFIGAYSERHESERGWHQPADSTYELDSVLSAEDVELLQSLMSVGTSAERLEFLGQTEGSPCGAGSRCARWPEVQYCQRA
jgi:hypothetical protein